MQHAPDEIGLDSPHSPKAPPFPSIAFPRLLRISSAQVMCCWLRILPPPPLPLNTHPPPSPPAPPLSSYNCRRGRNRELEFFRISTLSNFQKNLGEAEMLQIMCCRLRILAFPGRNRRPHPHMHIPAALRDNPEQMAMLAPSVIHAAWRPVPHQYRLFPRLRYPPPTPF